MLEVVRQAVEAARKAGADYADARFGSDESESLTVRNQEMEGIDRSFSQGIGIRVLAGGYWGFAATARPTGPTTGSKSDVSPEPKAANRCRLRVKNPTTSPAIPTLATPGVET